jgi:3'(2'), 5'-bisphosphate nucleotidase
MAASPESSRVKRAASASISVRKIRQRDRPLSHSTATTSDEKLSRRSRVESWHAGSAEPCQVAEGIADLYPRLGRTMEWDTAAGHAVVLGAGGTVTRLDGGELTYGKANYENPHFVARGAM